MHIWRPKQSIRVLAIGLAWQDGKLLACEVYDDAGQLKGVRPLGGGVEFGEAWQDALRREFMEELGVEIEITGSIITIENIYTHHGQTGHEVVFVSNIILNNTALADQEVIEFQEDSGQTCIARWFDPEQLRAKEIPLFPLGLIDQLPPR